MKNVHRQDVAVIFISALLVIVSAFYFREARALIGTTLDSALTYANGIVGPYNQSEWIFPLYFSSIDFFKVFLIPYLSGILFLGFGLFIYTLMRGSEGAFSFFLFHAGIAYFFLASFDFQSGHHASALFLLNFAFMPAHMTSFAMRFPERTKGHPLWPYLLSALVAIPYITTFYQNPHAWPFWERVVIAYAALSYFFWLGHLVRILKKPQLKANRVIAKSLLLGQSFSFIVPLLTVLFIFIFRKNIPLNWIVPINLIFPVSAIIGLLLGRLESTKMNLVQAEKMASLGQMLSGVAHEINNPVNFIHNNLAPLKEYFSYLENIVSKEAPKYRDEMSSHEVMQDMESALKNMEEGVARIQGIVSDLRLFGRSTESKTETVFIKSSIQSVLNILKTQWENRITVHLNVPDTLAFNANTGQLSQVWMNLLSNAFQAIPDKGDVWITADEKIISIKDNGFGISKSVQERIFDPFFTTKEAGKGVGLGLSIVQQIVKDMGGEINLKSEMGKGSEFIISLPG